MLTLGDVATQLEVEDDPYRAASELGLAWPEVQDAAAIACQRQRPWQRGRTPNQAFVEGFLVGMYVALTWRRARG